MDEMVDIEIKGVGAKEKSKYRMSSRNSLLYRDKDVTFQLMCQKSNPW